jgi:hypothetical protein
MLCNIRRIDIIYEEFLDISALGSLNLPPLSPRRVLVPSCTAPAKQCLVGVANEQRRVVVS